ncbi:MAG: S1/P1 nuclease [Ignavibacteriaceae bacterium]|jgi:hypothetical protein
MLDKKKYFLKIVPFIVLWFIFAGWGGTGHKIINKNITKSFPSSMNFPATWSTDLTTHASDADNRKKDDPNESPKHFIDIDNYPEFKANGFINQSYDANVSLHGSSYVIEQGTLPWAIQTTEDSLRKAFQQRNWNKAMLLSADLGHYVGDGHQPLHITENYNGGMTNQSGVHSRYETKLLEQFQNSVVYTNDSASYVGNISDYVFNFIYVGNKYVDSVLYGDSVAHAVAGTTSGTVYLQKYWELCGNQTILLMKNASKSVADLIYTAWIDAGSPDPNATSVRDEQTSPSSFNLCQNYPNPFNPSTSIQYSINSKQFVSLKVYDIIGNEVATLVNEVHDAGTYQVTFNPQTGSDRKPLTSGVYLYQLKSGDFLQTKKMIFIK